MKDVESLITNIKVCDKHVAMINTAIVFTKQLFPMNLARLEGLLDTDLFALDTLIIRFSKLQDTIGQKIFPVIIKLFLDKDLCENNFKDITNNLEKIGALECVDLWKKFRAIRNSLAHDYPDQPELTCEELNLCKNASLDLVAYWQFLKKFIDNKVLVQYKAKVPSM